MRPARVAHVDQAARLVDGVLEGDAIAGRSLARIAEECSNPDEILRAVLAALAVDGRILPPSPALRGACRAIQRRLEGEGRHRATT